MKSNNNYKQLETDLRSNLFDQEYAVDTLIKTLIQSNILKSKSKYHIYTFIGTPNCGKHYLCELIERYSKDIKKIKTYYMDQYNIETQKLSTKNFTDEIIEFCKKNPKSILVLEDIEKADLLTQLAMYSLFSDYEKSEIDFSNIIVVFTTTLLASLLQRKDFKNILKEDPLQAHTFLMEKLANEKMDITGGQEDALDKKLLSLLNEHTIIPFNKLSLKALIQIGSQSLQNMVKDFTKESKVTVEYEEYDPFISLLTLSLSPYINARHVKQKIPELLFNHIYEALKIGDDVKSIIYSVSDESKKFLNDIFENEQSFITQTTKQHKRVNLEWEIAASDGIVQCKIKSALYIKEKISTDSHEDIHVSDISFDDIAGHKKVKDELNEIVTLLKEPNRLKQFDLDIPKGMVLCGPTGMGKKLLARAFAKEADMPYIAINGSDLFNQKNINDAYAKAYSTAPAIIILEDIDIQGIIGGMISTMSLEPVLEQLDNLQQSYDSPIFTILTLNNCANLPTEVIHANRINIRIEVAKLDKDARRFFIEEVLKKPHNKNIDIERVVRYISGMSGNELKRIGQEASLFAARKGLKELTEDILLEQINIIKYGSKLENKQIRDIEKSMSKTAYHEAGHAVLSYVLLPKIKIEQVTVAPRSESLGFVSYHSEEYIDATSKEELFNDVCVLLAGRIAKMEKYGEDGMETGAVSDLEAATIQVYAAIALFGMDEELGYINISGLDVGGTNIVLQDKIEERILVWMEKAKKHTEAEVKRLWNAIDAVAQELIKKEVIDGEELKEIIKSNI